MHVVHFVLATTLFHLASPQAINPCIALRLPLCKIKSEFAENHGIQQEQAAPQPNRNDDIQESIEEDTGITREGDTLIVTAESVPNENQQPAPTSSIRASLIDRLRNRNNGASEDIQEDSGRPDACRGLRFCVLSKNVGSENRRATAAPKTVLSSEDQLVEQLLASPKFSGKSLLNLVLNDELEEAKQLIEDGADVNTEDQYGNSVLHIAAQNGRAGIIEDLILKGADVNKGNNHKNTALHLAAQNGWDEVAESLLKAKKIDVNYKDLHANTALHLAAQNGQIGVARQLIEAGANVDAPNAHKLVPLHLTAQNGHLELTKILVDAGANLNYQDLIGNTPLHTAWHTTHSDIARFLVASGADEQRRNTSGLTPSQLG